MRLAFVLAAAVVSGPALAGVDEAVEEHVLPRTSAFSAEADALADAARADCRAEALRQPFGNAFDAWLGISHLRLGPLETDGRAVAIGFWPDTRGMGERAQGQMLAAEDPAALDPEAFAEVSVAARGLFALERLLYEPNMSSYGADAYACTLARAIATDLARMAREIDAEWRDGFGATLASAGEAGNERFLSESEAAQALFTALVSGLEFTADQRLGRPLGTFDRPRPERAEARRSGRSLRNVVLSLEALRGLAQSLADEPIPATEAAFAAAIETADGLDDPVFAGVADPQGRLEVEILQQRIDVARAAVVAEIGEALGVSTGFNAGDGD